MSSIFDPYSYSNRWSGSDDSDDLIYRGGDDFIDGKKGVDTLSLNALSSDVSISTTDSNVTFLKWGYDDLTLVNIESISFKDSSVVQITPSQTSYTWYYRDPDSYSNKWSGSDDSDNLIYRGGDDFIDGEKGVDTLTLNALSSDVSISTTDSGTTFLTWGHRDLTLVDIESISFKDRRVDIEKINPLILGPSGVSGDTTGVISIDENISEVFTFTANESVTWSLSGGEDKDLFSINSETGALSFKNAPDFEKPGDFGSNNTYSVEVRATDLVGNISIQTLTIKVNDLDDNYPLIMGPSGVNGDTTGVISIDENISEVFTFTANESVTWSLSGGEDKDLFSINSETGALSFNSAPDFENPIDLDQNNIFKVNIAAKDETGLVSTQYLKVNIKDVNLDKVYNLGKLSTSKYLFTDQISNDTKHIYKFSTEETLYIYYNLKDFSYDLDFSIKNKADQENPFTSTNAGLANEEGLKVVSPGSYTGVIYPYEFNGVSSTFTTSYSLDIDTESPLEYISLPNDPYFDKQWYLLNTGQAGGFDNNDIFAPEAWNRVNKSPNVTVAVIDSGIDRFHPDLHNNIWLNYDDPINGIDDDNNGYIDDLYGWDFTGGGNGDNDPTPYNLDIHGTHVAGIIGAEGNNNLGITGVSWNVNLMNLKVFDDGTGDPDSDILEAIYYATDNGAKIINLSLGLSAVRMGLHYLYDSYTFDDYKKSNPQHYKNYYDALKYASDNGVFIVAAIGNDAIYNYLYPDQGNTSKYTTIPADFSSEIPGMCSVVALNNKGDKSSYSQYGGLASIAAPGGDGNPYNNYDPKHIFSTVPIGSPESFDNNNFNGYGYASGTSMAAPIVAGSAALLLAKDPNLTPVEIKNILIEGSYKDRSLKDVLPNGCYLDIDNSLRLLEDYSKIDLWEYLASNPDLINSIELDLESAKQHYLFYGFHSQLKINSFESLAYIASNHDLLNAFGINSSLANEHYVKHGYAEGRSLTSFSATDYLSKYSDLSAAFGNDETLALKHYIQYGYAEGRTDSSTGSGSGGSSNLTDLQALNYIASNSDLISAFGTDTDAAKSHYTNYGKSEGRTLDNFDEWGYLASNNDLMKAFGSNTTEAIKHFISYGKSEGRSTDIFNATSYLNNYGDLKNAFGDNQELATKHYVEYGFNEGRSI